MTERAIVTGASGFIGTRLVGRLASQGVLVRAMDIAPPRVRLAGVEYLEVDVRRSLDAAFANGVATIYNLAATHRTPGHPPEAYYDTNVLGAASVCELAERCGVSNIVFTSSISVYGPSDDLLDEASPLRPVSDYGRSKRMAEVLHNQWVMRSTERQLVVVRPGVVFGPGEGGNFTTLARALAKSRFAYPGRKTTIKSGGYVDELLDAISFAQARGPGAVTINFAYPEQSTTEDIVKTFGKVAGFRSTYPVLPIAPLLALASLFELANGMGFSTPIHRERVLKLVQSTRVAPSWLLANGYRFGTDMESALRQWHAETDGAFR